MSAPRSADWFFPQVLDAVKRDYNGQEAEMVSAPKEIAGVVEKVQAHEYASKLREGGMGCNCDLDNWEPERVTGHSHVCRIHKATMEASRNGLCELKGAAF